MAKMTLEELRNLREAKKKEMLEFEYVRSALKNGLKLGAKLGANPYTFGLVGSSDAMVAAGGFPGVNDSGLAGRLPAILLGGTCPVEYQVVPDTGT